MTTSARVRAKGTDASSGWGRAIRCPAGTAPGAASSSTLAASAGAPENADCSAWTSLLGADHVHDRVDEGQVGEGLREVAEVAAAAGVDLLGVEAERAGEGRAASRTAPRARSISPISHSADTSQNEQIVNVPSSPDRPSSVSSTR